MKNVCTIKNKIKVWDIVGKNMVDFDKSQFYIPKHAFIQV